MHIADADPDFRLVFSVDGEREQQNVFSIRLHESTAFAVVSTLGTVEHE